MKTKNLLVYLIAVLFSAPFATFAQDAATPEPVKEEPSFTISGSIDTYANTSLGYVSTAPSTSFANLKGFGLGMANLIASYQGEKSGFVADLVFGPRGFDAVFGNQYTNQRIVNQLYAYYKLSDKFTVNLGQFNTFVGYEVISPTLNFNYSTSYLFTNGPFNHTGVRVDYASEGGFVAKLALMNPTDLVEFNPFNTYTVGAQIGYVSDNGGVWLNALYGDQDGILKDDINVLGDSSAQGATFQIDLTTGWTLSESFYLGFNASYKETAAGEFVGADGITDLTGDAGTFYGVAIYPKVILSDVFSIGLRSEYFAVTNSYIAPFGLDGGDGNVIANTLSANYKVGNLTLIPEIRVDLTSEDSYVDADGEFTDMLPTLKLAAVYKF